VIVPGGLPLMASGAADVAAGSGAADVAAGSGAADVAAGSVDVGVAVAASLAATSGPALASTGGPVHALTLARSVIKMAPGCMRLMGWWRFTWPPFMPWS
jgi:hypothetical protein